MNEQMWLEFDYILCIKFKYIKVVWMLTNKNDETF